MNSENKKYLDLLNASWDMELNAILRGEVFMSFKAILVERYHAAYQSDLLEDTTLQAVFTFPNVDNEVAPIRSDDLENLDSLAAYAIQREVYLRKPAILYVSTVNGICGFREDINLRNDIYVKLKDIIEVLEKYGLNYIPSCVLQEPCPYLWGKTWGYACFDLM